MKKQRYVGLDILKFVLAIIIICHHYQQYIPFSLKYFNFYDDVRFDFWLAVECFFMISGYLSYTQIEKTNAIGFSDYIVNKVIRIYPMAVLSITSILILRIVMAIQNNSIESIPGIWNIFNNYLLTFKGGAVADIEYGINPPLWYLSVLMICYVVYYIVVRLSTRLKIKIEYLAVAICLMGLGGVYI